MIKTVRLCTILREKVYALMCECGVQSEHSASTAASPPIRVWERECRNCRKPFYNKEERDIFFVTGDFVLESQDNA